MVLADACRGSSAGLPRRHERRAGGILARIAAVGSRHVFLIGFMGSASRHRRALVTARACPSWTWTPDRTARGAHHHEHLRRGGPAAFRAAESAALAEVSGGAPRHRVRRRVVLDERNVARMRESGTIAYLAVSAEEAVRRVRRVLGRPLLDVPTPSPRGYRLLAEQSPSSSGARTSSSRWPPAEEGRGGTRPCASNSA